MFSEKELQYIAEGRKRARTDLLWLCRYILGFDKVVEHVHGPMIRHLQQFPIQGIDHLDPKGAHVYEPPALDPVKVLPGSRRRLLLAPRGWFKTSVNVVGHSIQWLLNYPNITLHLVHASQEVLEQQAFNYIKEAFHHNPTMRYFFPELCPPARKKEWGTKQFFDLPGIKKTVMSPSVSIGGIESIRTGMHYHVIKFTDIVDEKNSATKDQCEKIIYRYGMCRNLLISPTYWIDIEGTRYDYSDLYGRIIDEWAKEEEAKKTFQIFVMGCYKKNIEGGEKFSPNELEEPYILGPDGKPVSRFPEEFSSEALEEMRKDPVTGEYLFACQQLNDPVAAGVDEVPFPLKYLRWKKEEDLRKIPMMHYVTTVDLAEKQSERSDYTVITTAGWDRFGRCYVVDVRMGKFLPEETVNHLFGVYKKWKPVRVVIEETGYAVALEPTIRRVSEMYSIWPPFEFVRRETKISKADRIMSLQPWYKNGLLYFSEDLDQFVKEQIRHQLSRFPRYRHDDLLDTLADQFQKKPFFGPVKPSPSEKQVMAKAKSIRTFQQARWESVYGTNQEYDPWEGLGT